MTSSKVNVHLTGHECVKTALVLAVLSQKSLKVTRIRLLDREPGLSDDEVMFAKLIGQVTNGSLVDINETGTSLSIRPGTIRGGRIIVDVTPSVNMVGLLYHLIPLAPFAKNPFEITLQGGVTDDASFNSDLFRCVTIPLVEKFGLDGVEFFIDKRGALPGGGGVLRFSCPMVRRSLTIPRGLDIADARCAKVRGVSYALRVSPQIGNRLSESARDSLKETAHDVFLNTDCRGNRNGVGGNSPGFGIALWAEIVSKQDFDNNPSSKVLVHSVIGAAVSAIKDESPEKLGVRMTNAFLAQVASRGVVDFNNQSLITLMMTLCPQDIVRARFGTKLSAECVVALRLAKTFFGVVFKMTPQDEDNGIMMSCMGIAQVNLSRKTT